MIWSFGLFPFVVIFFPSYFCLISDKGDKREKRLAVDICALLGFFLFSFILSEGIIRPRGDGDGGDVSIKK